MALLEIRDLTKSFGGLKAVNELSFELYEGEILGLIGPNGAGKTTVFKMITGMLRPTKGEIYYNNKKNIDLTKMNTHIMPRLGLAHTFQENHLFEDMTVFENVLVARHESAYEGLFKGILNSYRNKSYKNKKDETAHSEVTEILEFMDLASYKDVLSKNLSHGHKRLLSIAVCLAVKPRILMLDEPVTGMNSSEVESAVCKIHELNKRGVTCIVIEHNMKALVNLASRVVVMDFGRKIAEGEPDDIMNNEDVIKCYLGTYKKEGA